MNANKSGIFWGILLVGAGIFALLRQLGYIEDLAPQIWTWIFALISLVGFIFYALSGVKQWGWLFPAGIFGGLATTAWLAESGIDNPAIASPLFFGIILPFLAAYLLDRQRNWWALIPSGVMLFLALTTILADSARGEWIGSLFLFLVALSFLIVFLTDTRRIWALITAYATGVIGIAPLLASAGGETAKWFGPLFLFAIALPFFVVYLRSAERWWAIIPAGILTVLAAVAGYAIFQPELTAQQGAFMNALMFGGIALVFALLWLRHHLAWAKVVTIILGVLAVVSAFLFNMANIFWPVALVLAGGYLLFTALRRSKSQSDSSPEL
jgi:hypothetical protein